MNNTEKLFVYGMLLRPRFQKESIGRTMEGKEGALTGYKRSMVQIKGQIYPILEKSRNRFNIVFGKVFEVTGDELRKLDKYETDAYRRIQVVLSSGEDAWVYVK